MDKIEIVFEKVLNLSRDDETYKNYCNLEFNDFMIIITKNSDISISSKSYKMFEYPSIKQYEEILKIEDNIPIPEIYLNIIKQFLSKKPERSKEMNEIIEIIKNIKEKIKNEINDYNNLGKHINILETEISKMETKINMLESVLK
uniref:Uncharacterized protein n=1 Tax=viral metagenome TaxID=1070528 RepID=A0A6C0H529_9ZZZZ